MCRDCEYGDYKDMNNEREWYDDFFPRKPAREAARAKFDEVMREVLEEIADDNGFGYEQTSKWTWDDWNIFREAMDL
jgi:hypothetical protein